MVSKQQKNSETENWSAAMIKNSLDCEILLDLYSLTLLFWLYLKTVTWLKSTHWFSFPAFLSEESKKILLFTIRCGRTSLKPYSDTFLYLVYIIMNNKLYFTWILPSLDSWLKPVLLATYRNQPAPPHSVSNCIIYLRIMYETCKFRCLVERLFLFS